MKLKLNSKHIQILQIILILIICTIGTNGVPSISTDINSDNPIKIDSTFLSPEMEIFSYISNTPLNKTISTNTLRKGVYTLVLRNTTDNTTRLFNLTVSPKILNQVEYLENEPIILNLNQLENASKVIIKVNNTFRGIIGTCMDLLCSGIFSAFLLIITNSCSSRFLLNPSAPNG